MKSPFEEKQQDPSVSDAPKLKLDTSKSKFQINSNSKKDFDSQVKDAIGEKNNRNKKALELGQKFLSTLADKTLNSNKSIIKKDLEKQICNDLFMLATSVNNDPNEPEGAGSLLLDTLFFKSLLIMRDRLNELEFLLHEVKTSPNNNNEEDPVE